MVTFDLIGSSPKFRAAPTDVDRIAPVDSTVLIQGEAGTGKEVITRAIHEASPLGNNHFVAHNSVSLPALVHQPPGGSPSSEQSMPIGGSSMNCHTAVTNPSSQEIDMTAEISHATPIVFVVDNDGSVRESLELLLRCEGWEPETFASAQEFLNRPRPVVPSCLVLDVFLPGLNGLDLQKRVALERTDMPIIFITSHGDVPTSVQAMKAGAVEFLMKPFEHNVLVDAIRESLDRSRLALAREMQMRSLGNHYALLTRRERQVMALVVSGLLNKQVGGELGISEITVKAHRGRVMQKMGAQSLADLVNMFAKLGAERAINSSNSAHRTVSRNELQVHVTGNHPERDRHIRAAC
jgi:FixJ family two-component response regulator